MRITKCACDYCASEYLPTDRGAMTMTGILKRNDTGNTHKTAISSTQEPGDHCSFKCFVVDTARRPSAPIHVRVDPGHSTITIV